MKRPVLPVVLPADIRIAPNGRLPGSTLRSLHGYPKGGLHRLAASAFNAMQLDAYFAGIALTPTSPADCYRTLEQQERTFLGRYTTTLNGSPVKRTWQGKTWYLLPGKAPSAAPGTSNHGLGLAVDINLTDRKALPWLLGDGFLTSNALRYGFSWEGSGDPKNPNHEDWHLRYVCGDQLPKSVLDAIAAFPALDAR